MAGPRPLFVALVLASCALVAGLRLLLPGNGREVELVAVELVHVQGGQAVLVLREKPGERRLPVPVSKEQAKGLSELMNGRPETSLSARAIAALRARVLRVILDDGGNAHVSLVTGSELTQVDASAVEAIALGLHEKVPIVIDDLALDQAGISPDDLRAVRAREPVPAPPVQRL